MPKKDHLPKDLQLDRKHLKALLDSRLRRHVKQLFDAGMSAYQMGKLTGVDPSTFSKIVEGESRGVGIEVLYKMTIGLGIPANLLMSESPLPASVIPRAAARVGTEHHRRVAHDEGPPIHSRAAGHGSTR